jgi:hypothetical protein
MWAIMPLVNGWTEFGEQASYDLLGQSIPTTLLIAAQGVDPPTRDALERFAEKFSDRVFCVFWNPPIPSLSGVWNRCLDFVWSTGERAALVVNHDVRVHAETAVTLSHAMHDTEAWFVSAVGVTAEQFSMDATMIEDWQTRGGPDFSCFLIRQEGHARYRFDEGFIPAFCEDLSTHREYLLGGDGRRIFSVNVPYLHFASQTLKTMPSARKATIERQINTISRVHYERCWGGPVNQETYVVKGDPASAATDGSATTPYLQAHLDTSVISAR